MKIKLLYLFLIVFSLASNAQDKSKNDLTLSLKSNDKLESKFINEVFGNHITIDSQQYKNLVELLQNRVSFTKSEITKDEKYTKLSEIKLFNKYNALLKRDETFESSTFNILKYDLNFYSSYPKVYRFDNSDWIIVIQPTNK